jgi:ribosomal protein L11 methylase PrmA
MTSTWDRDPGSFRDPRGSVYLSGSRVLRTVSALAADDYQAVRDAGLYQALAERGMLLATREVDPSPLGISGGGIKYVLEHPRIPFVSYPYEWCFAAHRAAALAQLDLHLAALERGFTLSDASAYNVQFLGSRPIFIDHLSFRRYRDGELWDGHRQFCMQFLNPLLLAARLGVHPNAWFRGSLEGIEPEDLVRLLPWRKRLSWAVLSHVVMQAFFQRRAQRGTAGTLAQKAKLPLASFRALLASLRDFISGLSLDGTPTVWGGYAMEHGYTEADREAKRRFVAEIVTAAKPAILWDFGCNTGDFAELALDSGAGTVVGFDFDHGALDSAFARARRRDLAFLPLWLDAANPSPAQGWAQRERRGLAERANADALIAMAFLHHLAIGRNVPLEDAVDWLIGLAPVGAIEFAPKTDPMVQRLLALRADVFPDYTVEAFRAHVARRARIRGSEQLPDGGRLLVSYDRT